MIVRWNVLGLFFLQVGLLWSLLPDCCCLAEYSEDISRFKEDLEDGLKKKIGISVGEKFLEEDYSVKTSEIRKTIAKIEALKEQIKKNLGYISPLTDGRQYLHYEHVSGKKQNAETEELQDSADKAVDDTFFLHDETARIRAAEAFTEQLSLKFRTDFKQKLQDMENSMTLMSQQHLDFVNILRSSIGSGMEAFRKQMESMSNVMSKMVSSHNEFLSTLSTQLNNQGKAEQKWAGEAIKAVAQNKETASSSHRTFLSEQFVPQMNVIQMLMQSQIATLRETVKTIFAKIEQEDSAIKFHLAEQKDRINTLWKNVQLLISEQRTGLDACQQHVSREMLLQSEMYNEVDEQFHIIQKAMSKMKQSLERHNNQISQEGPIIQKNLEELSSLGHSSQVKIESETKLLLSKTQEFATSHIDGVKDIAESSKENLCKVQDSIDSIKEKRESMKSGVLEFGYQSEQMWEQNYRSVETSLRQHSETELQDLQDNQFCIQELRAATKSAAEQHESILERQKLEFEGHIATQKSILGNMEDSSAKWAYEFSSRIWKREEEIDTFLMEELQRDGPSASDMKSYFSKSSMSEASPHEKILHRLRAAMQPSQESSAESGSSVQRNEISKDKEK